MTAARSLERWRRAGLLDDATHDRIQAWEASQARPVWLWGLAGIGCFAIVLGVAALVAANWALIPGRVKIGGHLAVDVAVAMATFAAWRAGWDRVRELLALLLFGLALSGLGLVGQVYQLGGTTWQALLVWLLACTPFLGLVTRSGPVGVVWSAGVAATVGFAFASLADRSGDDGVLAWAWIAIMALLAAGLLRRLMPGGERQGRWIRGAALVALLSFSGVPPLSLALLGSRPSDSGFVTGDLAPALAATACLIPFLALDRWRRGRWDVTAAALAAGGWLAWFFAVTAWEGLRDTGRVGGADLAEVAGAVVLAVFWAGVGALALRAGRRGVFVAAIGVIALRLLLLYWEALGSRLSTGLGLLAGGVVCIALAALGWAIMRAIRQVRA